MKLALITSLLLAGMALPGASHEASSDVDVLIDGAAAPRYYHGGTVYLEAIKSKEYAIRLTNPTGCRVAVALSVDGLNTIDARHTDARSGRKWVLDGYESAVIRGWQTNAQQARRFFFTSERNSYGARLGQTANLGIISAVFFKEKIRPLQPVAEADPAAPVQRARNASSVPIDGGASRQKNEKSSASASVSSDSDYAATGIGDRVQHEVQWVHMALEDQPFKVVNLRYEFRPALVKLGVLPPQITADPLQRRQTAKGFQDRLYCPEP